MARPPSTAYRLSKFVRRRKVGVAAAAVVALALLLGIAEGRFVEKTYWRKIDGMRIAGNFFTGIEISTAAGVCGVLDLLLDGKILQRGFVRMEDVSYNDFMATAWDRKFSGSTVILRGAPGRKGPTRW